MANMTLLQILVLVIAYVGSCQGQGCPDTYQEFRGKCYFFSDKYDTWDEAKKACGNVGGQLATVPDKETQIFLSGYVEYLNKETFVHASTGSHYHYQYLHDLGVDLHGRTSVTFSVKTCHDAHVALSTVKNIDTSQTYEIVIGGWSDSQSVIRDCKQCAHHDEVHHTQHPVSCTDYHNFWISWENNVIRVGHGYDVGQDQFMSWADQSPHPINYLAVATGFGSQAGNWSFPIDTFMPGKFWLGGTNLVPDGSWTWLPSLDPVSSFTDWAPGEPDNVATNQHCMVMDMRSQMQWRDDNCADKRNFICERPLEDVSIIG